MSPAVCRSCGAPIRWVRTSAAPGAKRMPLDPEPVDGGNVRLRDDGTAYVGDGPGPSYRTHFASCPDADRWRSP